MIDFRLARREHAARVEPLEARIAPANLIDGHTIAYTDLDGDEVTIVFSKDVFTGTEAAQLTKANEVFKFDTGDVAHEIATLQQLRLIDFTKFSTIPGGGSIANGVHMTITAVQKDGGNGLADVGFIKAAGVSLGKIVIDGDLGKITAGGSALRVGVVSLTVDSIGKRGTTTQIPVPAPTAENPAPDIVSVVTGELTALKVLTDVQDARFRVVTGSATTSPAKLGSVTIGGSIIGRAAAEVASDETGVIETDRNIGPIKIGGLTGGGGTNSGRITAGGGISSIRITGSIVGGAGGNSGIIAATGNVGAVTIGGDIVGGAGDGSGGLRTFGSYTSLTIGDDLVAGTGIGSGFVSALGVITKLTVKGDIDGTTGTASNSGANSAKIYANGLPLAVINGDVRGGFGPGSGVIESGRAIGLTTVSATAPIKTTGLTIFGDVTGGVGDGSGSVLANGAIKLVTIKGDLAGGAGKQSGVLRSGLDLFQPGSISTAAVNGAVIGGGGDSSGAIIAGVKIGTVTVGHKTAPQADALKGGMGPFSGSISANGKIGTVKIIGDVAGGGGLKSGSVLSFERSNGDGELPGSIGTISISGRMDGGAGPRSGLIYADGAVNSLTAGVWVGGTGTGSGSFMAGAGILGPGNVGTIRILGILSQSGDPGEGSANFMVDGRLKSFSVGKETVGATLRVSEDVTTLDFKAGTLATKVTAGTAITKLTVTGGAVVSSFLAGYDIHGVAVNPDAQIGTVVVNGDWSLSNLVAGVAAGADGNFGTADDAAPLGEVTPIISKIASVVIKGSVSGPADEELHYGIVAQTVGKVKIGSTTYPLNTATPLQVIEVTERVTIREVAVAS